jgi:hypothetical protein
MNEDVVLLWPLLFEGEVKTDANYRRRGYGDGDGYGDGYGNGRGDGYGNGNGNGYDNGGSGQK